jgi:hypothetical protein
MRIPRNLGPKERFVRIAAGILMIGCGLAGFGATPLGWGIAAAGAINVVMGLIRYCPACAIAGKKNIDDSRNCP